jgi:hypothetical protein
MALKPKVNKQLQSLTEIEKNQQELIKQQHEELNQRQHMLNQMDVELQQKALEIQRAQHAEIRRQYEQSIDFAIRTVPFWFHFLPLSFLFKRANTFFELLKSQVLLKSVQAMAEELKQDGIDLMAENDADIKEVQEKISAGAATSDMIKAAGQTASDMLDEEDRQWQAKLKDFAEKLDEVAMANLMEMSEEDRREYLRNATPEQVNRELSFKGEPKFAAQPDDHASLSS